jgi:hypothetical protein
MLTIRSSYGEYDQSYTAAERVPATFLRGPEKSEKGYQRRATAQEDQKEQAAIRG